MELHVDLPTDKTNRRRVQNRTAQRKFRSKWGTRRETGDFQDTRADRPMADPTICTDSEPLGEQTSTPLVTPPLQQLQQLQQLRYLQAANYGKLRQYQGLSLSHPHQATTPVAIPEHDRSRRDSIVTADHDAASSGQASTPTGPSEFNFSDSVGPDNRLPLDWRAPRYYDRPLDFNPLEAMMAAATREMDTFWDLGPGPYAPSAVTEDRDGPAAHPPQPAEPSVASTRGPGPRPRPRPKPPLPERAQTEPTMPPADGPSQQSGSGPLIRRESQPPSYPLSYQPSSTASGSPPRAPSTRSVGSGGAAGPYTGPPSPEGRPGAGEGGGWIGALHIAARRGHEGIVEALLGRHSDVDEADSDGRTALVHAALAGHAGVARRLLERGARLVPADRRGRSALHWAAAGGHAAVLRLLLAHYRARSGGDGDREGRAAAAHLFLDAPDAAGWTALHLAIERNCEPAVCLLLEAGADCHARARKTCNGDADETTQLDPA